MTKSDESAGLLLQVADRVASGHTALLVIDMQNDFCAPGGYIEKVIRRDPGVCGRVAAPVNLLVEAARAKGVPVVWLRADYSFASLPESMRARLVERGVTERCCIPGTWGYEWHGVQPAPGERLIDKHCYDGFVGTSLDADLRAAGIRAIVFAGVQTNVCVEATLRHAHALGYYCTVAEDCVASHTPAAHAATLATVRFHLGDVVSRSEIETLWAS